MESLAAYHADLSHYGSSALRLYDVDPLAFYRGFVLGQRESRDTEALSVGTAFHAAMEGQEIYDQTIAVAPEGLDRRTKEGKKTWAEFTERTGDRTIISLDNHILVWDMVRAVNDHPVANELVQSAGRNEVVYRWRDDSGMPLKVRFDRLLDDNTILEYKSIEAFGTGALKRFGYACRDRRYDMQAALYSRGREQMTLCGGDFYYVVVTKTMPAQCMLVRPKESYLARGTGDLDRTIRSLGVAIARETLDPGEHNWVLPHFTDVMEVA